MATSLKELTIHNQTYPLPQFLPDATQAVVRGLNSQDLAQVGIEGVVINTYHLRRQPGTDILCRLGGVKKLMNWSGLTASDSGGFQLFSLIQQNPDLGNITDEGVVLYSGKNRRKKQLFTPEDSIRVQFAIYADIMICLDDFTPVEADEKRIELSVNRTIAWAKRCKQEYERQLQATQPNHRPWLLAVIQGHRHWNLRQHCAQELQKIGFDGYGLGGWPFQPNGKFDYEMCEFNAQLTPNNKLRFALGIGMPENISQLYQMGYHLFDCVLPTRDARHQRLYVYSRPLNEIDWLNLEKNRDYQFLYLDRGKYKLDQQPLSGNCSCPTCRHYSRAYLHHLFKINDPLAFRLAETHNLQFYTQLIAGLRRSKS